MIPEMFFTAIMVIVLMRLLFPELFMPEPPTGVIGGGLTYNGAPVADATVTLYSPDMVTEVAVVTSGADGKYVLPARGKRPVPCHSHFTECRRHMAAGRLGCNHRRRGSRSRHDTGKNSNFLQKI
jgi:hypothetical protein